MADEARCLGHLHLQHAQFAPPLRRSAAVACPTTAESGAEWASTRQNIRSGTMSAVKSDVDPSQQHPQETTTPPRRASVNL